MKRFIYSKEMLSFLRRSYGRMMIPKLTATFNRQFHQKRTAVAIKSALSNHNFSCGRKGYPAGYICSLTKEQIKFVKRFYRKFAIKYVTEGLNECFNLNKTEQQIKSFVRNHHIFSGRDCFFSKGHTPWNKGTRGMGICKGNSGNFRKGHVPANRKPLWSERINPDGYIWIKIPERDPHTGSSTRYVLKHAWIWEKIFGKIPRGSNLVFKDGNKLNCKIRNLMLVSDAELLEMNRQGFGKVQTEIKPSIIALSKLRVKIFSKKRRNS